MQFGYTRLNEKSGKIKGYIKFDDLIRETEFPENVIHNPLKSYLHIGIGSVGKFYARFNG
jgi:hypothetical protein